MFYMSQALLKIYGIEVRKHSAVEAALGLHFVKSGKLDSQFHHCFIEARRLREVADYHIQEEIVRLQAATMVKETKEFIKVIKTIIKKRSR